MCDVCILAELLHFFGRCVANRMWCEILSLTPGVSFYVVVNLFQCVFLYL